MELLSKAVDAAKMFWEALDERERMLVLYGSFWLLASMLAAVEQRRHARERETLKAEILGELRGA